ncbi:hypothetical protein ACFLRA_03970, partial [Bdellovibrionota bacterium]
GRYLEMENHLLVDFGIVESDGADIERLKKLSDVIIELASKALLATYPEYGIIAEQLRGEVQNLMHLVIEMDGDDRLAVDTIALTRDGVSSLLGWRSWEEFTRTYERETFWIHHTYKIYFRVLASK